MVIRWKIPPSDSIRTSTETMRKGREYNKNKNINVKEKANGTWPITLLTLKIRHEGWYIRREIQEICLDNPTVDFPRAKARARARHCHKCYCWTCTVQSLEYLNAARTVIARIDPEEAGSFNNHYIKWNSLRKVISSFLRCCTGKQTYKGVELVSVHACKMVQLADVLLWSNVTGNNVCVGVRIFHGAIDQRKVLFSASPLISLK